MTRDVSRFALFAATLAGAGAAHALPLNPQTVASSGATPTFTGGGGALTIDQTAERVVIDWDSFAIGAGETVTFNMPGGTAIAVNRVPFCGACSVQPFTVIDGVLASNGNVWILDSRGVFFGGGAQVDVHGLLAATANLASDTAFVGAGVGDPVSFVGATAPGAVAVDPGAQITVRGGAAIFVGDARPGPPAVRIAGTVTGLSPTSRVLLGATHSFSLRFAATPPDPMSNSDLQLFDFVIDPAPPRSPVSASGTPIDAVFTQASADISAGAVWIAGSAPAPDPVLPGDPVQFRIGGKLESTAGPLVINGAGGIINGGPTGSISSAEIDVVFEREVIGFLDQMGMPQAFLTPVTELRSAGGFAIGGRSVSAPQVTDLGNEFGFLPVPDHVTVVLASTGPAPGMIRARESIALRNVAASGGIDLMAGTTIDIRNSLGGPVTLGNLVAPAGVTVMETPSPGGTPGPLPVSYALGNVSALSGPIGLSARGAVTAGVLSADSIMVDSGADTVIGGAVGNTLIVDASGDAIISGPVTLGAGAPAGTPTLQVVAGQDVTFSGAVTSVRDIFVSAGGLVTTTAALRVTGAAGGPLTVGALPVFSGVDIRASDVALGAALEVQGGAGAGAHFLTSASAAAVGGGVTAGFSLTNAEVQRIAAPLFAVRVLPPSGPGVLTVGALTLDATRLGETVLAVGGGGVVRVPGIVTGVGAPALRFGDGVQTPARIEVSGALGVTGGALGRTALAATGDILIGTQAFIDRANQTGPSDFDPGVLGAGFGGATDGQLFLVAGETTFTPMGAILSQNTGGAAGGGLFFAVPATGGVFGVPAMTTRVDIFGRVRGRDGVTASGADAALVTGLLNTGVMPTDRLSINGCTFGAACASASGVDPVGLFGVTQQIRTGPPPPGAGQAPQRSGPAQRAARTASAIEVEDDTGEFDASQDAREARDPGVGSANEDLWPSLR